MEMLPLMMPFVNQPNPKKVTPSAVKIISLEERAIEDIKAINAFVETSGKEPLFNRNNFREYELCEKLQRWRYNKDNFPSLHQYDEFGLLNSVSLSQSCKKNYSNKL